jgi:hypothetical protein
VSLKIGDTIYRFDLNRRAYPKDGGIGCSPIYREHFEPLKIIGENKVSWLLERSWKASKKDLSCARAPQYGGRGFFTAEGMEEDIWRHDHRHHIQRLFDQATPAQLKQIADILGYAP